MTICFVPWEGVAIPISQRILEVFPEYVEKMFRNGARPFCVVGKPEYCIRAIVPAAEGE